MARTTTLGPWRFGFRRQNTRVQRTGSTTRSPRNSGPPASEPTMLRPRRGAPPALASAGPLRPGTAPPAPPAPPTSRRCCAPAPPPVGAARGEHLAPFAVCHRGSARHPASAGLAATAHRPCRRPHRTLPHLPAHLGSGTGLAVPTRRRAARSSPAARRWQRRERPARSHPTRGLVGLPPKVSVTDTGSTTLSSAVRTVLRWLRADTTIRCERPD